MELAISNQKFIEKVEKPTIRSPEKTFKEELIREMINLHERVPIDKQVQGFRTYFH